MIDQIKSYIILKVPFWYDWNFEFIFKGELQSICQEYYSRICDIESTKYDLEKEVEYKDYMVSWNELLTKNVL